MYTIKAQCKTITPLISSGADRNQFELRETGIKHMLRFWWRAFRPEEDLNKLFEIESSIFGSTDQAAAFRLRILTDENYLNSQILKSETMWPHEWGDGIKYWLFPIYERRNNWITCPILQKNTEFALEFIFSDLKIGEIICRSLWLASMLGGLGSRSRRGAGSFEVTKLAVFKKNEDGSAKQIQLNDIPDFKCFCNLDEQNIQEEIQKAFKSEIKKILPTSPVTSEPKFPQYSPGFSNFYLYFSNQQSNSIELWNSLGQEIKEKRFKKPLNDARALHQYVEDIKTGGRPSAPSAQTKQAFGLPIQYHFKSRFCDPITNRNNHPLGLTATVIDANRKEARRASPLWISIHSYSKKRGGSGFFSILTLLWSEFLGDDYSLLWKLKYSNDSRAVRRFLDDPRVSNEVKSQIKSIIRGPGIPGSPPSDSSFIVEVLNRIAHRVDLS